ncbi:MAG: hypothetical protein ACK4PR_00350 [Gammaproteobacteria bacterium]
MDTVVENQSNHNIVSVIKESWQLTKGFKWNIMKILLLMCIVLFVVEFSFFYFFQPGMFHPNSATQSYPTASPYLVLIVSYVSYLFIIPVTIMGMRRAIGLTAHAGAAFKAMFNSFSNLIGIIVALMLIAVVFNIFASYMSAHHSFVVIIAYIIAFLINILISLTALFAILLVITKKVNMFDAISQSFAGVIKHAGFLVGTYIVLIILLLLSAIPLLIGLVWTTPMSFILFGVLFRNIYGVKNAVSLSNAQPGASEYSF